MIDYIKGTIAELTPAQATLEAHGVGYALGISLNTYTALQGLQHSDGHGATVEAKLYVHEAIREDAYTLYGFATKRERSMFQLLITVSGVGANTARMMLSGMSVAELTNAISTGNVKMLQAAKGVGKMTAQRIVVDLRDKIAPMGLADEIPAGGSLQQPVDNAVRDEAVAALTMLGFSPAPTQKVVTDILRQQPQLPVEQVVKAALKQIK